MEVAKRMKQGRVTAHRRGCAWKVSQSPDGLYGQLRRMVHPTMKGSLAPLMWALQGECEEIRRIRWNCPLVCWLSHPTTCAFEVEWRIVVGVVLIMQSKQEIEQLAISLLKASGNPTDGVPNSSLSTAAAFALFGWFPYHPNAPSTQVQLQSADSTNSGSTHPTVMQTSMVQCRICERRVGLWAFEPPSIPDSQSRSQSRAADGATRTFDLVDEHLDWCPIKGDREYSSADLPPAYSGQAGQAGAETSLNADAGSGTEGKGWWMDLPLLRAATASSTSSEAKRAGGDWLTVSDRLVRKPWQRK